MGGSSTTKGAKNRKAYRRKGEEGKVQVKSNIWVKNSKTWKSMHRVGLFGYYKYGNFGDDMMAYMFYKYLEEKGHKVKVWGLLDAVSPETFRKTDDIEGLVEWSDCVVYGGGGILIPESGHSDFEEHLDELINCTKKKDTPLYAISIGGDSTTTMDRLSEARRSLLRRADFLTFRNPEDKRLAKSDGVKRYKHYPDVVWSLPYFFDCKKRGKLISRQNNVLLEPSNIGNRNVIYAILLGSKLAGISCKLVDLKHESLKERRNILPLIKDTILGKKKYKTLEGMLKVCGKKRAVVTSRLHLGIANMSLGGVTFLLNPNDKSRILFERMGLNSNVLHCYSEFIDCLSKLGKQKMNDSEYHTSHQNIIEKKKAKSLSHFKELEKLLDG